jgi:hypothetical protein
MDPQQAQAQAQAMHMFAIMAPFIIIFWIVGLAIIIIPFWQIFKKAGMSGALSILMAIPLVNLVMLYVLAFSQWKVVPVAQYIPVPPVYPPPPSYPPAV